MAVLYDLVFNNNVRAPVSYVCYGLLNNLTNSSGVMNNLRPSVPGGGTMSRSERDNIPGSPARNLSYVVLRYKEQCNQFQLQGSDTNEIVHARWESEMRLLTALMPSFRGCYIMNTRKGEFWVKVNGGTVEEGGMPADKTMFLLTIARNMCRYINSESWKKKGYSLLREKFGCDPLTALLVGDLFQITPASSWGGGGDSDNTNTQYRLQYCWTSESNIFHAKTFTKESLVQYLTQSPDWNPWKQKTFAENGNGYKRDSHMQHRLYSSFSSARVNQIDTTREAFERAIQSNSDEEVRCRSYNGRHAATLTDGPSVISTGTPEPIFRNQAWHPKLGMCYLTRESNLTVLGILRDIKSHMPQGFRVTGANEEQQQAQQ